MKKVLSIFAIVLILILSSCEETTGRGNLNIILESPTKTLKPDDRSSMVVKYNVRGIGPAGKSFSKDSASKSVTIEGIPMGTWTISATGYNSDSVGVISGSKTFSFSNSSTSVFISMSSKTGAGSLQIDFNWNEKIQNPILLVSLEGNESVIKESYTPESLSKNYKLVKGGIAAGNYILKTELFNGKTKLASCVDAVQIVGNKTTSGSISLLGFDSSSLYLINSKNNPVTGHFALLGYSSLQEKIEAEKEHTIKLIFDSTGYANIDTTWYLDGNILGTGNQVSFTPSVGNHTINAIVTDTISGTTESMTYRFSARPNAKKGSASLLCSVDLENTSKLLLAQDSIVGALPDNHFVLVTPSRNSMQVFSILNNTVSLAANQTYNATDLRFTWLANVTNVYSNPQMNFFAVQTSTNCLYFLYYNRDTERLDIAFWNEEPLCLCDYVEMPPAFLDLITSVVLIPSTNGGGTMYVFDNGSRTEELLSITTSESEITNLGTSMMSEDLRNKTCADGCTNILVTIIDGNIVRYANVKNGVTSSNWYSHSDSTLTNINKVKLLNQRYAIFASCNNLNLYEYYSQQKCWVYRTMVETDLNDFCTSADGAYIYIADTSNNVVSYRSGLTDNFGKLYSQKLDSTISKLIANSSYIVGLNKTGALLVFEIIKEDVTT